ncbi:OLC1v1024374C1 [Oldenlandia corymbosa var. corymbosa]|uniref:OLC1v1024374C1 n=1 Tax=Oldenlandia corymbosa var. corymbosa TaxID=529605 RepID=A0AAV1C4M7_OLDCO|nr:OLC1v1024374C1 [Oldenlandia corymbosa var. corymbosa]
MDEEYSTLDLISPLQDSWKIRVRLICVWKKPLFSNPSESGSIEMVLMDHLENKIHATVKRSLIGNFMGVINEGSFKIKTQFGVASDCGNFRITRHPYKINFSRNTQVRHCIDLGISLYGFKFASFSDLLAGKLDETCTIDIIGEIVTVGDLIHGDRNGKSSRWVTLEMQDCEDVKLTVTLWDEYAQIVTDHFAGRPGGCVVMIVQFARIRTNMVTNSLFSTRLFIDSEIDEIVEYKSRMVNAYGTDDPSRGVSYLCTRSSIFEPDDFLTLNPKKRIDELEDLNKAVELDGGGVPLQSYYYCNKCDNNVSAVVRVLDDSKSASFLLFDKDVYKCIRKTAMHVREDLLKVESDTSKVEGDRAKVPKELERLIGQKFIFKIEVSEYNIDNNWPVYTVLRMSSEMSIINAFESCSSVNQDVDADVDTSTTKNTNITPQSLAGKDSINSCTGEVDACTVQLLSTATSPLKRTLQFDEEDATVQSSSTKAKIELKLEKS